MIRDEWLDELDGVTAAEDFADWLQLHGVEPAELIETLDPATPGFVFRRMRIAAAGRMLEQMRRDSRELAERGKVRAEDKPLSAQELAFCLLVVGGESQNDAYAEVFAKTNTKRATIASNAHRVANRPHVARHLREMREAARRGSVEDGIAVRRELEDGYRAIITAGMERHPDQMGNMKPDNLPAAKGALDSLARLYAADNNLDAKIQRMRALGELAPGIYPPEDVIESLYREALEGRSMARRPEKVIE